MPELWGQRPPGLGTLPVAVDAARIAIAPLSEPGIERAIVAAGAVLAPPEKADGVIWTEPQEVEGLRDLLGRSAAGWIQLPFAGIEAFVDAGMVDASRTWTCAKGIYGAATAEHAVALVLAAARSLHRHARARSWRSTRARVPERRLAGSTIVLVGTGGIGRAFSEMIAPFGAGVVAVNRSGTELAGAAETVTTEGLPDAAAHADFVVLASALTPHTRGLIGAGVLARMRDTAWVVNVARGGLIDTPALVDALRDEAIGGAALDVTDPEPLPPDHPLWDFDNVLVTPHVANTWDMALPELRALVERNVGRFVRGEPLEGLVDPSLGY